MSLESHKWKTPPRIKILEAASAVASGRVKVTDGGGEVVSSKGDRVYQVIFRPPNKIMSNDNGSKYKGYLGYPAIAYLMAVGVLPYDPVIGNALKDVPWRDLVERFGKYDEVIDFLIRERGLSREKIEKFIKIVMEKIKEIGFVKIEYSQRTLW